MIRPWRSRVVRFGTGIGGAILGVLVAVDQLGNAMRGGDPDMTISTDCGYELRWQDGGGGEASRFCRAVCWALDFVDENHCREAVE
jgi:hypothetical protein